MFPRIKVAVFVDGCFWHGCPEHFTVAKTNAEYWAEKVATNRARDADATTRLRDAGWSVIRVWEHEDAGETADEIEKVVRTPPPTAPWPDPSTSSSRTH